ncbi:LAMI_0H19020g1_1 [Lachancea mirantina]|uniref:4-hydroxy-3-methoxy-5-polyprenylbenzoate decarboxylase n=1 Tax=Lachancea mirantina TaxID=1230905 RepID=A0A1G4KJS2_9SACH|nr:LAMI_0H19020g1_1 [Lachancea mirantina]
MLSRHSFRRLQSHSSSLLRRNFFGAAAVTLGGFIFGQDARLADSISEGEVHNKNVDYEALREEKVQMRLKSIKSSRPMAPQYEGHVPLYPHERFLLFVTSGLRSYYHPENGDNIVQLGEATAFPCFLENLKEVMLSDKTGRQILREQPDITTESLHMDRLKELDENTVGYTYYKWLLREGVSPDTRAPVKYINDPLHAYIFKRYRQCHDFYHAINALPINIEGEIAVKTLEAANIGVPMAGLGALLAPLRLSKVQKQRIYDIYIPWALRAGLSSKPLINVYWEKILDRDVDELREDLEIRPPPDLRTIRSERAKLRKAFKQKYENYEKQP